MLLVTKLTIIKRSSVEKQAFTLHTSKLFTGAASRPANHAPAPLSPAICTGVRLVWSRGLRGHVTRSLERRRFQRFSACCSLIHSLIHRLSMFKPIRCDTKEKQETPLSIGKTRYAYAAFVAVLAFKVI